MNHLKKFVLSAQAFARELRQPSVKIPSKRRTLGLALGGGFARGLVHIGILKVLEEEMIPVDFMAGTSVGSVIGAAYCSGVSAKELEEIAALVRFRDFARWTISRFGFCDTDRMERFLLKSLKCLIFEELKIPLAVAATNFSTGEPVVFRSGSVVSAVRASCAYPGIFLPVKIGEEMFVDGMLGHAVPCTPLREMGADCVVGIYLNSRTRASAPRHMFDVVGQCFSIAQHRLSASWRKDADLILEPNVDGFAYDCFERFRELVASGEETMRAALPEVRRMLQLEPPKPEALTPKPVITPQPGATPLAPAG